MLCPSSMVPDQSMPFPPTVCTPGPPGGVPGHLVSRSRSEVWQSASPQEGQPKVTGFPVLLSCFTLIPSRGREEVHKPHPCTGELQVRGHQGGAYLLHHTCRGRHALPAAPGTGSSTRSRSLSRSQVPSALRTGGCARPFAALWLG